MRKHEKILKKYIKKFWPVFNICIKELFFVFFTMKTRKKARLSDKRSRFRKPWEIGLCGNVIKKKP